MEELTEKERQVLKLRLNGASIEDVYKALGVTRQRARQIEHKALKKLLKGAKI